MVAVLRFRMMRAEQRSLIWTSLAVTGLHLVLLIGLPQWKLVQPTGNKGPVMMTRAVPLSTPAAAPATEPAAEAEPSPTEAVPTLVAEAPKTLPPPKPKPKPRRKPKPRPKAPAQVEPPTPQLPSTQVVNGPQGSGESSLFEIHQGFVAGPVGYRVSVQTHTTEAEDAVVATAMEHDAGQHVLPPRSVRISYATSGSANGTPYNEIPVTLDWHHDGRHYSLNSDFLSTMAGNRRRFSHGIVTAHGMAPVVSTDILDHERHSFRFDYASRQIAGAADALPMEFKPGTQDSLSLMVQLAALAAAHGKDLATGMVLTVPVLEPGGIRELTFKVLGEETLTALEGKSVKAVHLAHQTSDDAPPSIEAWLAPSLDYMPARWRTLDANGDMQDQVARKAIEMQNNQPDEAR
jgi:hypothetical protein